jgi:alpha-galactosidase/6-phospho-beta-glucosidase family protein
MSTKITLIGAGSAVFSLSLTAETGSKELLFELILMDPWTRSEQQAWSLLEDILALPYHEEMRRHYR